MNIFSWVSNIFNPVVNLVDELHVSDEERGKLRNELAQIQASAQSRLIELEKSKVEALSKLQQAEASSKYFITATWRPICSVAIVGLIIAGSFGIVTLTQDIYDLASIFLGTYAGGRSLEKLGSVLKLGK